MKPPNRQRQRSKKATTDGPQPSQEPRRRQYRRRKDASTEPAATVDDELLDAANGSDAGVSTVDEEPSGAEEDEDIDQELEVYDFRFQWTLACGREVLASKPGKIRVHFWPAGPYR